jgi:hypothetical protein
MREAASLESHNNGEDACRPRGTPGVDIEQLHVMRRRGELERAVAELKRRVDEASAGDDRGDARAARADRASSAELDVRASPFDRSGSRSRLRGLRCCRWLYATLAR